MAAKLRRQRQRDFDIAAGRGREIAREACLHFADVDDAFLMVAAKIELEGFRFDDVGCRRRNAELGERDVWLAVRIEPRELVSVPDVDAVKRQRSIAIDADRRALRRARDRKQEARIVAIRIDRGSCRATNRAARSWSRCSAPPDRRRGAINVAARGRRARLRARVRLRHDGRRPAACRTRAPRTA